MSNMKPSETAKKTAINPELQRLVAKFAPLTKAELFERFLHMEIVHSVNGGHVLHSYVPEDILNDWGREFIGAAIELIAGDVCADDEPEVMLRLIIDELREYANGLDVLLEDFTALARAQQITPSDEEPHDITERRAWEQAWADAESNPIYRVPDMANSC